MKLGIYVLTIVVSLCTAEPRIIEGPSSTFGLENQKIVLRCRITAGNYSSIKWFHDDAEVTSKHPENKVEVDTSMDEVVSSLSFHLVRSNQGLYFCNVSHSVGWEISKKATVRITYLDDTFILEPQDKTVSVGETVLLECIPPTGLPKPNVQWYKDNQSLMKDERMQVSEGGSLRIDRISWKDGGVYWCAAEAFAFRRQSSAAVVTVRYRPYFLESPLSQSVQVHSTFELSCRAAGEPIPTIFWRRDPPFLEIPFERTRLLLKGTLQFTEVRLEDAGDYVCRAVSSSGVIEAIAHINVVSPPGLIQTPPSTVSVLEGERVELLCSALGSPDPDIRWIRRDPLIYYVSDASPNYDRIFVSSSGSLIFFYARPEDSSHYECRASSPAGLARSLTFVEVKRNPYLDPARFGALSSNKMYVRLSRTPVAVRIVCNFPISQSASDSLSHSGTFLDVGNSSAGSLSIVWRVDGDSLYNRFGTSNRTVVEQNGSLVIHNILHRDEGNYSCLIINHLSRRYTSWTIELFVDHNSNTTDLSRPLEANDLPNPPSNLTVVGIGDTWLAFRWSDRNENSQLVGYKLFYLPIVRGSITPASSESRSPLALTLETEYKRDTNFAPSWDSWLSTPDVIRKKQAKLIRLIPNTGYWVEVRKVNQFGLSPGNIFPRIIYTSEKPSQVKFPTEPSNNSSDVHTGVPSFAMSFIGGNTAVGYQDMLSNFQSITFGDMNVRSLTASEILISWMTRSASGVLQQIDGFKVNIKPVPMSRCLVVASSSSVGQSSPFTQGRDGMTAFAQNGIQRKSLVSPAHCSLSSDELLEQILRMSTTAAVLSSEESSFYNDTIDPQSPVARSVFATHSVSLINPVMKAIGGGLLPFTCYEVDVTAFKDDLTYGRLWSRPSRPELALTLDASPSRAPRLVTADWLLGDERFTNPNVTTTVSPSIPSGVRLIWKPLELRMAHGALIGYVVHFLANESDHSRSLKVSADLSSKDIFGLNPNVNYMIYIAGITCRGEGVRGPGYPLPSAVSFLNKLYGDAIPDQDSASTNDWRFPLWAYGVIVALILGWVLFGFLISIVARRGALKRRCDSHVDDVPFQSSMKNTFWHGCAFCHAVRIYQRNPRKQHVQVDRTQPPLNDGNLELGFVPSTRINPSEMSNLLQNTTSSKHTSSDSERTCRELPDVREEDRFLSGAQSTSGSGSRGNPSSRKLPVHPEGLDEPNYLIGDDAEVYANSDPSVVSDPNGPTPRNLTSAGSISHTGLFSSTRAGQDCYHPSPNRPQLPDSINIPFPVPPSYQYNGFVNSHTSEEVSNPNLCAEVHNFFVPQLRRSCDVRGQKGLSSDVEDVVPPYASCAVLPASHQLQSTTDLFQQYSLQPGIMGQRPTIREPHLNPTDRGSVLMSQSVGVPTVMTGVEFGARRADQNAPFQPDGLQVMPIWTAQTRLVTTSQLTNGGPPRSGVVTVANPLHSIPPPPEYPPPPLPAVSQSRLQPGLTKPYYSHSPGTGHSSSTNLEYDVRFVHSADGFHAENARFVNIYTPGAIYVRAPSDVPLAPPTLAGPPHIYNGLPSAHTSQAPKSTTTVSQFCLQQPDMSVMGLAKRDRPYLRVSSKQRVGRSVPPGTRVGDGSSSELSTANGLGSDGRENESGKFIRSPDSVISNSCSGSSDSSGSGLRPSGTVTHLSSYITPQSFHIVTTTSVAASTGFLSDPSIPFRVRHEPAPKTDIKSTLSDDTPTGMSNGHPSQVCHINNLQHT